MNNDELSLALDMLEKEKGISKRLLKRLSYLCRQRVRINLDPVTMLESV